MKNQIYQHFKPEEKADIDYFDSLIQTVSDQYYPQLTHFLNPRQQYILQTLMGNYPDVEVRFDGGYTYAEKKRAYIFPPQMEPRFEDFELQLINIHYPVKFTQLKHGQVLGTLMNCGLDANVFGDILNNEMVWQFWVEKKVSDYVCSEVTRIGSVKVRLEKIESSNHIAPQNDWKEETILVKSLRLDAVVANAYHISRQDSKKLITSQNVRVNWAEISRVDTQVFINDIISVRGYGRVRIEQILGMTQKDKYRLQVGIIRK